MNYSKMTREELRELMLKERNNKEAFKAYMDKINREAIKTVIPDDVAADPVKFAEFLSRNK